MTKTILLNKFKESLSFTIMRDKGMKMRAAGIAFIIVTALVLLTGQTAMAQDLVVLSHRFDEGSFSSEIIGEIMNNDTKSYDKFDVNIIANFRDTTGMLLTSENGFIDAERLGVGSSSAFNIFLLDRELPETASTYDLIVNDDRVVVGAPLDGESSNNDDDNNGGSGSSSTDALEELEDLINDNNDDDNDESNLKTCPPGSTLRDGKCMSPFDCPAVVGSDCQPGEGEVPPISDDDEQEDDNDTNDDTDGSDNEEETEDSDSEGDSEEDEQ